MHCTLGHLFDDQLGVGGVVRFQLANNHLALPTKRIATLVRLGRGVWQTTAGDDGGDGGILFAHSTLQQIKLSG